MLTSQLQTVIVDVIVAIKDFWRYKKTQKQTVEPVKPAGVKQQKSCCQAPELTRNHSTHLKYHCSLNFPPNLFHLCYWVDENIKDG